MFWDVLESGKDYEVKLIISFYSLIGPCQDTGNWFQSNYGRFVSFASIFIESVSTSSLTTFIVLVCIICI